MLRNYSFSLPVLKSPCSSHQLLNMVHILISCNNSFEQSLVSWRNWFFNRVTVKLLQQYYFYVFFILNNNHYIEFSGSINIWIAHYESSDTDTFWWIFTAVFVHLLLCVIRLRSRELIRPSAQPEWRQLGLSTERCSVLAHYRTVSQDYIAIKRLSGLW